MGNVVCTACGTEGTSKCPFCRSVFPEDSKTNIRRSILSIEYDATGPVEDIVVRYTAYPDRHQVGDTGKVTKEGVEDLVKVLLGALDDWTKFNCAHQWAFSPGQTSTIGCEHGAAPGK